MTRVSQEDDCSLSFATKIWGKTKEFKADIETQRPDERIKWSVSQGITHSGVVTFHELAPRLTRIEVNLDIDPGSLIEKAARGMRHVKRAVPRTCIASRRSSRCRSSRPAPGAA